MLLADALRRRAAELGPALAREAYRRGLAVTASDGATRPIPIALVPVVLEAAELRRRQVLAARLSSAGFKMARLALARPALREPLLRALSPLEAELAALRPLTLLATTRVDFLVGAALEALELNATIPAMQGYSDIAAEAFLDVVGASAGVDEPTRARWRQVNGSNARALHRALLAGYTKLRPGRAPTRLALLCRRHDAQLSELRFLRDRFEASGLEADLLHPDQLVADDEAVRTAEHRYDLVYRHLFVRRLEEPGVDPSGQARRLLAEDNGRRAVLLNPPASHVEVKSLFALLSLSQDDHELARDAELSDDERTAVAAAVPWTRALVGAALVDQVAAEPDRYVLKRAWDYGGRAVFIGRDRDDPGFAERVRAAWPEVEPRWDAVCARAANDQRGGGFVVQRIVEVTATSNLLCTAAGVRDIPLTVDFSAYASVGLDEDPPWGAVCRGAPSRIVNIVGGGGVVPVVRAEVADELAAALAR